MSVWHDVRFDRTAAVEAAEAVREVAGILDAMTEEREVVGILARRDWEGRSRREADAVLALEHQQGADLVADLRRAAERIHLGAEAAALEQAWRERRREELREHPARPGPELVR